MKQVNQARIAKLQHCMKEAALDVFVVSTQDSLFYLSGAAYVPVERPFFIIVWPEGAPSLVVPQVELEHMRNVDGFQEIGSYFEFPSLKGKIGMTASTMLPDHARVGIEPDLSVAKVGLLKAKEIVPTDIIPRLRMIKTPDEIKAIRTAAKVTDHGMRRLHHGLYAGENIIEAFMPSTKLQNGVISAGSYDYVNCSFLTAGWPAPKSSQPHSVPDFHAKWAKGRLSS